MLIGVPGFNGITHYKGEYGGQSAQEAMMAMVFWCGLHMPMYDFAFEVATKREQFRARNLLISAAIGAKCDYLLMLDDDMLPPPDLVQRLLAHGKPVVGALYWQRGGAYHPIIMREFNLGGDFRKYQFLSANDPIIVEKPGLHQVDVIGGGCMLFDVNVFAEMQKPYFWWEAEFGTDISICTRLRELDIPIHVDTAIEIPHVDESGRIITRRTIPQHARDVGEAKESYWAALKAYLGMTDEALLQAVYQAKQEAVRTDLWLAQPRETWEQVRSYYQEGGDDHLLNMAYWHIHDDPSRTFVMTQLNAFCPKGGTVLDYGCGNGFLSFAMAQQGRTVLGMDLSDTASSAFLQWRIKHESLHGGVSFMPFDDPVPDCEDARAVDGAVMISVLDHCWDPWGALRYVTQCVKPGGFLVLDNYNHVAHEAEPQHLCRYDPMTFTRDLAALGWRAQAESPYLFLKD